MLLICGYQRKFIPYSFILLFSPSFIPIWLLIAGGREDTREQVTGKPQSWFKRQKHIRTWRFKASDDKNKGVQTTVSLTKQVFKTVFHKFIMKKEFTFTRTKYVLNNGTLNWKWRNHNFKKIKIKTKLDEQCPYHELILSNKSK